MSLLNIFKNKKTQKKNHPPPNTVPKNAAKQINEKMKSDILRAGLYDSDVQAIKKNLEGILSKLQILSEKNDSETIKNIENKIGDVYQELLNTSAAGESLVKLVGEPEKTQTSIFSELLQLGAKVHDQGRTIIKIIGDRFDQLDRTVETAIKSAPSSDRANSQQLDLEKIEKILIALHALSAKQDNNNDLLKSFVAGGAGYPVAGLMGKIEVERTKDIWLWHREKDSERRETKVVLIVPSLETITEKTVSSFLEVNTVLVSEIQAPAICGFLGIVMPSDETPPVTAENTGNSETPEIVQNKEIIKNSHESEPSEDEFREKDSASNPDNLSDDISADDNTKAEESSPKSERNTAKNPVEAAAPLFDNQTAVEEKADAVQIPATEEGTLIEPEDENLAGEQKAKGKNYPSTADKKSEQKNGGKQKNSKQSAKSDETKTDNQQTGGSDKSSTADQNRKTDDQKMPRESVSSNTNSNGGTAVKTSSGKNENSEPAATNKAVEKLMMNVSPEEAAGLEYLKHTDFSGTEHMMKIPGNPGQVEIVSKE